MYHLHFYFENPRKNRQNQYEIQRKWLQISDFSGVLCAKNEKNVRRNFADVLKTERCEGVTIVEIVKNAEK